MKTVFSSLFLTLSLSISPLRAGWETVFAPDFSGDFKGEEPNRFNYVGSGQNGEFVSVADAKDGRFRMVTAHKEGNTVNHSATRLSRHGNGSPAQALDIGRGVALLRLEFRWKPEHWHPQQRSILDLQIGEFFRSGAYNPARGGKNADGPSFASLLLEAMEQEGNFRFVLYGNKGGTTPAFALEKDAEGFYNLRIAAAFNNTPESVTVSAPGGKHTLQSKRLSVWNGEALLWDNHFHPTHIRDADFQHVSFGFGNGTDRSFEEAQAWAGIYELCKVEVLKWRE